MPTTQQMSTMDVRTLTPSQTRWIERCARRLKYHGPLFTHVDAVELAFDLFRAWPDMDPVDAADVFLAPQPLAA